MSDFVLAVLRLNKELVELIMALNAKHWYFLFVYIIPSAWAFFRKKHNLRSIVACNLLLGFTGIVWFVILWWAIAAPPNKPVKNPGIECKHCKELIRSGASFCNHCKQNQ